MLEQPEGTFDLHAQWPPAPLPGRRPFQSRHDPDESLIFYGRNREKDEILARLNTSHLVFIVGPSGCGKSSLVKVGVLPALEAGPLMRRCSAERAAGRLPGGRPVRSGSTALPTCTAPRGPPFSAPGHRARRTGEHRSWLVSA